MLIAPYEGVGREHPLSHEKLCPILAFYVVDGWEAGCKRCIEVLRYGGLGHTLALHCEDEAVIRAFAIEKPVNRIVINSPSSQGAVGYHDEPFPVDDARLRLVRRQHHVRQHRPSAPAQHQARGARARRLAGRPDVGRIPPSAAGRGVSRGVESLERSRANRARSGSDRGRAPVQPRLANPARIPFSREDVRSIIATRLRDKKER